MLLESYLIQHPQGFSQKAMACLLPADIEGNGGGKWWSGTTFL